jgi:DNA-binding Xre family transcriptional regulator
MHAVAETSQLLKDTVEARMAELGLSPKALADRTGLTQQALLNVRNGKRRAYQRRLTVPLCEALGWKPDGIKRLLAGQKPELLEGRQPADTDEVRAMVERLTRVVEHHSEQLARLVAGKRRVPRQSRQSASRTS